jgi:predicted nucleic acid-binding protein
LIAPDLIVSEVTNALVTKVRRREILLAQARAAQAAPLGGLDHIFPTAPLADRALEIAAILEHPAYDCFYIALAEHRSAQLVTADARLLARLATTAWSRTVVPLESHAPRA